LSERNQTLLCLCLDIAIFSRVREVPSGLGRLLLKVQSHENLETTTEYFLDSTIILRIDWLACLPFTMLEGGGEVKALD
jgi:hypothetical protein